ncbi:hypothetical protein ACIQNU_03200 [Streptomyces sp. NPDC091292]|uniref:hypothetical protein n=1 Tax=Streptomyces sp. NPDC091292 TaxID=3365991 RepID=UPI003829A92B
MSNAPPQPRVYETHVTVSCPDSAAYARLESWAARAGLKVTHIVLARGRTVSQPMLTLRDAVSYEDARAGARALLARLAADGFVPVRVKVESAPWAPEVPRRPTDADGYFEHHVKLLLDAEFDRGALTSVAVAHGAHLSWNARRPRDGGRHERFVTQRCHAVDAGRAERALDALLDALAGHEVMSVEREFVLYDSDLSLDDGWIGEGVGACATARVTESVR